MSLREQFEKEQRETHQSMLDALFETGSKHYIAWLEKIIQTHLIPQYYISPVKFKLIRYTSYDNRFIAHTEDGNSLFLDLDTDCAFPEITEAFENIPHSERPLFLKSLEGKYIECESILPFNTIYWVYNAKFINSF